jgi:hypothetical protein
MATNKRRKSFNKMKIKNNTSPKKKNDPDKILSIELESAILYTQNRQLLQTHIH